MVEMTSWFWLLLLFMFIWPQIQQKSLTYRRYNALRNCEKRRGTRIITLIHRQESSGFFGMFSRNYIDIEDSEAVLRAIRLTDKDTPIDILLHTPGGLVLAADEILMDPYAVLGPVDPQLGQYPAASILKAVAEKPIERVEDNTLILADMSRKAIDQTCAFVSKLLKKRIPENEAEALAKKLTQGTWTHDYAITAELAKEFGFPVRTDLIDQVCDLMSLYPQSASQRPSVQFIPMPYKQKE